VDVFIPIPSSYDRNLKVQIIVNVSRVFNPVLPGRTLFELKQLSFNLVRLVSRGHQYNAGQLSGSKTPDAASN